MIQQKKVGYQEKPNSSFTPKTRVKAALFLCLTFLLLNLVLTLFFIARYNWDYQYLLNPFIWISWTFQYNNVPLFYHARLVFLLAMLLAMGIVYLYLYKGRKPHGNNTSSGTARWANIDEIKQASLLNGRGVYVGGYEELKTNTLHYLRHDGPEHICAYAPTRSGKGVSLVLPTLLGGWSESAVILDIKGELYDETSGWRHKGENNIVLRFDPARPESIQFNPLEEVRISQLVNGRYEPNGFEVADAQNIAMMLANPEGKDMEHFEEQAYSLIIALILHNRYKSAHTGLMACLADVGATLKDPDTLDVYVMFSQMMTFPHLCPTSNQVECSFSKDEEQMQALIDMDKSDTHPVVLQIAADMYKKAFKELSGIISTASRAFTLFLDPVVAKNTSRSDFALDSLRNGNNPYSLYVVVRPNDIDRLRPLTRIIFTLILKRATETMDKPKHRLLMLLDEFTSMGRLSALEDSIAYVGGYGIKIYLIIQDTEQLHRYYGKEETVTSNCHIRIAFAPNKVPTAEMLSKMTGTMTVTQLKKSVSGKKGQSLTNITYSTEEKARPLLTIDEVMQLPAALKNEAGDKILAPGAMLIFAAGFPPVFGKQTLWFFDPIFQKRHSSAGERMSPPTVRSQRLEMHH